MDVSVVQKKVITILLLVVALGCNITLETKKSLTFKKATCHKTKTCGTQSK